MEKLLLKKTIKELFPILKQSELVEEIVEKGQFMKIPSKTGILATGSIIQVIPIVCKGSLKVVRKKESGQTVFLYYIRPGESCALTLSSCMKKEISSICAIVESDVELIALPVEVVYDFVRKYPSWNDFMISMFSTRFEELLGLLDDVCFQKIDSRLMKYLSQKCDQQHSKELIVSHQEIANDLGTSREVISRLLKQLENKGMVKLARGRMTVLGIVF